MQIRIGIHNFFDMFCINKLIIFDIRFGSDFGAVLAPFWLHFGTLLALKITKKSVPIFFENQIAAT